MSTDRGSLLSLVNPSLSQNDKNEVKTPLLNGKTADKATYDSINSRFQRFGPDGLEAWGVAIAASLINFIMAGINRASGILYVEFIDAFQVDRMKASLPFSIRSVARNLLGPVVGIFGQKYGVRRVIFVGGVLASISTAVCFFLNDIFWISTFWGCFSGLGAAMIMTLTQAAIGQHFVKHISTASGIGLSGGCFGSFVFPAMFEILIEKYSIQGTFLFIAGMIMHVIPLAIILRKPTWLKKQRIKGNEMIVNGSINSRAIAVDIKSTIETIKSKKEDETNLLQRKSVISIEKISINENHKLLKGNDLNVNESKKIDTDLLWVNRNLVYRLLTNNGKLMFPPPDVWKAENMNEDSNLKGIMEVFYKIANDVYTCFSEEENFICTKDIENNVINDNFAPEKSVELHANGHMNLQLAEITEFNVNPIDHLQNLIEKFLERDKNDALLLLQQSTSEDLHRVVEELKFIYIVLEGNKCNITTKYQATPDNVSSFQSNIEPSNTFCSHIKTAMWLNAKPLFLLICLCRCSHFASLQPILTTVVDFSRDKGLPVEYGKYAIATLALGDLFGRLFMGWLTDRKYLTLPRYMFIFMVLQGIFTAALALTNSAESLLPVLTVYGLLLGCTFIQHPVLISHYLGKDEQSIALGCLNFFPGIIGFGMPFYIGYFRDTVGSYNGMFYISGSIGLFIGCLWLAEPYLLRCSLNLPQQKQQIPV